jgi:beta-glucosidase-like glycosyl hydrolase
MDVYRLPPGGRNFEYMNGEDPFLGRQLVPEVIQGITQVTFVFTEFAMKQALCAA